MLNTIDISDPTNGKPAMVKAGKVYCSNVDNGLDVVSAKVPGETADWMLVKNGSVVPLVPAFNPAAEQMEPLIQARITELLVALAGCKDKPENAVPALTIGDKVYQLDESASMKTCALKDEIDVGKTRSEFIKLPAKTLTWGWLKDKTLEPLVKDFVARSVMQTVGTSFLFTEEQVTMMLKALAAGDKNEKAKYAYVCSGRMFTLGLAGKLTAADHPAAAPCAWPLAHDVRPASQALGAKKCTDCHSVKSPFFFGKVTASGPMKTSQVQTSLMHQLEGQDNTFHRLFGLSFLVRIYFKLVLLGAAGLIAAVLALYGLLALNRVVRFLGSKEE
jgi:hypothetical protein